MRNHNRGGAARPTDAPHSPAQNSRLVYLQDQDAKMNPMRAAMLIYRPFLPHCLTILVLRGAYISVYTPFPLSIPNSIQSSIPSIGSPGNISFPLSRCGPLSREESFSADLGLVQWWFEMMLQYNGIGLVLTSF